MIRRHSIWGIFLHWSNAVCWLFLLFSGFALLANPEMSPIGQWWTSAWSTLFGGLYPLLSAHVAIGMVWIALCLVFVVVRGRKEALPFMKEITSLHPVSDMTWCIRKGLRLTVGEKFMRRMGMDPALPPQGFYNAGQKLAAIAAVASSFGLIVTGCIMVFAGPHAGTEPLLRWSMLIHFCCAGIMAIVLPIHIYMAALAPGEGPALRSMFTGFVPEDFVRRHNPLWFKELKGN